jgi:DNA-binding SARP family transcriptional activator/TolB-like protein/tetratricopeptide (TPR) repeat protein
MQIRLTTLGAVRLHRGDALLPDLPAQRLRFALLVFLATERDVSRDDAVTMFWPDRETGRGKHALRQMLYELRHVLGDDWVVLQRDRVLCTASVDAAEFEAAAAAGDAETALRLYAGPFMSGFALENGAFEGWVERRRGHLARLQRRLRRELIGGLAAAGRTEELLAAARRWVELDPLDDEAAHTYIERLADAGQRTAALQYYDAYERQLAAELQVAPLEETVALVHAIRHGSPLPAKSAGPVHATVLPRPAPATPATGPGTAPIEELALEESAAPSSHATEVRSTPGPGVGGWERMRSAVLRIPVRRRIAVLLAVLTLAMSALIGLPPGARPAPPPIGPVGIAILPFEDFSTDARLSMLSQEISDELARSLAHSRILSVVPPTSVNLMRDKGNAVDEGGRMFGSDYLVRGNIRREGDRVRLALSLIDGITGREMRSDVIQRPWTESFSLIDDVVTHAATFLRAEIGAEIETRRVRSLTPNERAWQLVLDGRTMVQPTVSLVLARDYDTAETVLLRADSIFALAAALDTRWAEPLIQRAEIRDRLAFIAGAAGRGAESRRLREEGIVLAEQAIAREPDAAGAHELRGTLAQRVAVRETDARERADMLRDAEQSLRRATEIEPHRQTAWGELADLLLSVERYGEAKHAARSAYRSDPHSRSAPKLLRQLYAASFEVGEDREAEGWCLDGRSRFNDAPFVWCLLALNAWAESIEPDLEAARRAVRFMPEAQFNLQSELRDRFDAMIAVTHIRAGQPDSARAILRRLERSQDAGLLWMRAAVHVAFGEDSAAIALLDRHVELAGESQRHIIRQRPFWKLRNHPDYPRLAGTAPL